MESHTVFFKQHVADGGKKTYYRHGDGEQPNQWFEPVQVWEVKAADLSISPVYTAAIGEVRACLYMHTHSGCCSPFTLCTCAFSTKPLTMCPYITWGTFAIC